ncbi:MULTISPECIES: DUF6442 family protein [unclassified Clostridioides]|uniref:DUF6442 family protein n=1 Tax=unclassified Clostridioides TaxID=2635829 RepID=UPI001D11A068|nr:hypothetical protein [Clostridioides sp. ES-S-0001-02]MCC0673110.1 hypothetical protein [Clostridioides sp. ES-S-0145-01]MCC0697193.1 hypothetical protein [Clostridioides sp. ES-S-0048-02]
MNKEEILNKSRQSRKDEGLEYVENKGRKIGYIAFTCVFCFIVIFNAFIGQKSYTVAALFWTFIVAESIAKYQFTRKKQYIFVATFSLIVTITSLINFVSASLR